MDPVIALASDLVAIDSVNPSLIPGGAGEGAIATFIASWLMRRGFDVQVDEVAPGRPNVIAVAAGRGPGPTRLLCGHTDTVGVDGMTAPFSPAVRDGRLYGRGAQDMKGGVAAMLSAAASWLHSDRAGAGRIVVAAVSDEEYASIGADALARQWRADEAVIPEPTDLSIGIAHKGFSCVEVTVHGRAAHGSRPADGRDAILKMGRIIARLDALDRALQAVPPHALLGTASLHAGTIHGGSGLSVYPSECVLQVERRTLPGESIEVALDEIGPIVSDVAREDADFTIDIRLLLARPPYATPAGSAVVTHLDAAVAHRFGPRPHMGLSYWTDAAILGTAGTPTALFGPRGAGLHGVEEYVRVDDVIGCRDVLQAWLAM